MDEQNRSRRYQARLAMGLGGGAFNPRTLQEVPAPLGPSCTVPRGVGGTCSWSRFHLGRPFRPSPMTRKCARLSHKKDHREWPRYESEQSTRGAATSQNPALASPNGPPNPSTPALGGLRPPRSPPVGMRHRATLLSRKRNGGWELGKLTRSGNNHSGRGLRVGLARGLARPWTRTARISNVSWCENG